MGQLGFALRAGLPGHAMQVLAEPLWDVSPDGTRFAFVTNPSTDGTQIGLILNWTANWKARQK